VVDVGGNLTTITILTRLASRFARLFSSAHRKIVGPNSAGLIVFDFRELLEPIANKANLIVSEAA